MAASDDTPTPPPSLQNLRASHYTARIIKQKVWRNCNVKNQHFMGVIVGREGTGKSHTALKIASGVDPTFTADRVFFDPSRLLETLKDDEHGAGTAVVIDEAGVGLGNRTWYEKDQILLNQALQTARDDNMAVFFTLPRLSELDSQTVGRLHSYIEMTEVNPAEGYAKARWLNIKPSRDESGQIYKKYPRLRIDGVVRRIERLSFTPPDESLVEAYEPKKEEFKESLNQEARDEATPDDDDTLDDPKAIADDIRQKEIIQQFINDNHGQRYLDRDEIELAYDIGARKSGKVKKLLLKEVDDDVM